MTGLRKTSTHHNVKDEKSTCTMTREWGMIGFVNIICTGIQLRTYRAPFLHIVRSKALPYYRQRWQHAMFCYHQVSQLRGHWRLWHLHGVKKEIDVRSLSRQMQTRAFIQTLPDVTILSFLDCISVIRKARHSRSAIPASSGWISSLYIFASIWFKKDMIRRSNHMDRNIMCCFIVYMFISST